MTNDKLDILSGLSSFLSDYRKYLNKLPPHIREMVEKGGPCSLFKGKNLFHWHCGFRMYKFRFLRKLGGPYNVYICDICGFKIDKRR